MLEAGLLLDWLGFFEFHQDFWDSLGSFKGVFKDSLGFLGVAKDSTRIFGMIWAI